MTALNKQALREAAQEEIMLRSVSDTSDAWQDEASPEAVLALLDELEAANSLNKHLELAIRKAEGCSEALRRKTEAAEKRIADNERVMCAVVEAASIRGIRPFEGIECDPPTLEENAEACGDAMSARIRELEANPPKPHHNGLMQISNELVQARQRIAELEAREVVSPDGYVITPAKANMAMIKAGGKADRKYLEEHGGNSPQVIYQAMIASAGIGVKGE